MSYRNECENVIYESTPGDFLSGYSQSRLKIINKQSGNSNRTIVHYYDEKNTVIDEKTSDNLVKLIGQGNYNYLLTALSSVLCLEFKVRGILAILTRNDILNGIKEQDSEKDPLDLEIDSDKLITNEIKTIKTEKTRMRRRPKTYVVTSLTESQENNLSLMINDNEIKNESSLINQEILKNFSKSLAVKTETQLKETPDINVMKIQETEKVDSPSDVLKPLKQELSPAKIQMPDGSLIMVSEQPEDFFHIATPEILKNVTDEEQKKLVTYQLYIDWKFCLERNEDNYLPLHLAVQFNDINLLRRQCLMLIQHEESLDIPANNMTALEMSLTLPETQATLMLLHYGADPLLSDDDERTILHMASELKTEHLKVILEFCRKNARQILQENDTLDSRSDSELAAHLLDQMCTAVDIQGYTPLMTACHKGISTNVSLLIEASPSNINKQMPNSGRTALFLAVEAACLDAIQRGNKSVVADEFAETLKILIENGADHCIQNYSGTDVNELLSEYNMPELMKLFTSLVTKKRVNSDQSINYAKYMILKEDGKISVTEIEGNKSKKGANKNVKSTKGKSVATKNKNDLKNYRKPNTKKKDTNLNTTEIVKNNSNNVLFIPTNTTQNVYQSSDNVHQTPSSSQNVVKISPNKPIIIKKSTPIKHGIIISQLKNNIIYQSNELNMNKINPSPNPNKITIKSNVKLTDPILLKRPSTSMILSQVKKKKQT